MVVEHTRERAQHGGAGHVALLEASALLVDVEQYRLGVHTRGTLDLGERHRIVELTLEVLHRGLTVHVAVLQQVAEHLQEVRLAASEVALNPHARIACRVVEPALVGLEEVVEMPLQLARDHILLELLLYGVVLADVDDTVDVAVDVLREHLLDLHGCAFLYEVERAVVVAVCELAEKRERPAVIGTGVGHHHRHVAEG